MPFKSEVIEMIIVPSKDKAKKGSICDGNIKIGDTT